MMGRFCQAFPFRSEMLFSVYTILIGINPQLATLWFAAIAMQAAFGLGNGLFGIETSNNTAIRFNRITDIAFFQVFFLFRFCKMPEC